MFYKKQVILEILDELNGVWDLAMGLKNLIIISNDEQIINSVYEIINYAIFHTKNNIEIRKIENIREMLENIKKEEKQQKEKAENFLDKNLDFI